ncbi:hypothetical protein KA005_63920, partial [bacterium]|nr:hypothetical protein [bacterium]
AAAHLIHGSTERRFSITYSPGGLTREEVESVGFKYMDIGIALKTYKPEMLKDGFNTINDEEIYFISKPSLGLWTAKEKLIDSLKANLIFAKRMTVKEPNEPIWQQLVQLDTEDITRYEV